MTKHVGIVCEFNPFHKGHEYFLSEVKKAFPEKGIVCVMSGNFVQRGTFAIQEKYSRAKCALHGGADLVLELPFPFSCLSAESFARSAVFILSQTRLCDTLAFGVEEEGMKDLFATAENLASPAFAKALEEYLSEHQGTGFPAAREEVYTALYGPAPLLRLPNASLALEYLISLRAFSSSITPFPVCRRGQRATEETVESATPSATALRRMIFAGEDIAPFVPESILEEMARERESGTFPVSMEKMWGVLRYLLATTDQKEMKNFYGFSSLSHRAVHFSRRAQGFEDLVEQMKNATFTDSRIRRGLLSLLCKIPRYAEKELPAYTLVLAANKKGREMLAKAKEEGALPIYTKPAHLLRSTEKSVLRQAGACFSADEIFSMAMPGGVGQNSSLKKSPTIF